MEAEPLLPFNGTSLSKHTQPLASTSVSLYLLIDVFLLLLLLLLLLSFLLILNLIPDTTFILINVRNIISIGIDLTEIHPSRKKVILPREVLPRFLAIASLKTNANVKKYNSVGIR